MLFCSAAQAQDARPAGMLLLSSQSPEYAVTPYARVFEDPSKQLSFQQVLTQFKAGQGATADKLSFGYSSKGYWLLFTVYNRNQAKTKWVLDFGGRMSGTIGAPNRLAVFTDAAPDQPVMLDGRLVTDKQHTPNQSRNAVPFAFEPGVARIVGVYIEPIPGLPLAINLKVEEQAEFASQSDQAGFEQTIILLTVLAACGILLLFLLNYNKAAPGLLIAYLGSSYFIFSAADELVPHGNNTPVVMLGALFAARALLALSLTRRVISAGNRVQENVLTLAQIALVALGAASLSDFFLPFCDVALMRAAPLAVPALVAALGILSLLRAPRPPMAFLYTLSWAVLAGGAAGSVFGQRGVQHQPVLDLLRRAFQPAVAGGIAQPRRDGRAQAVGAGEPLAPDRGRP